MIGNILMSTLGNDISAKSDHRAMVSFHALARRFQRGRDRSDEAVIRDMSALLSIQAPIIPTADADGYWLAQRFDASFNDKLRRDLWSVRTFVAAEAMPDGHYLGHGLRVGVPA